ncbi:MAG: hypothetical protein QM606_11275, partial [Leucobacter sp.]
RVTAAAGAAGETVSVEVVAPAAAVVAPATVETQTPAAETVASEAPGDAEAPVAPKKRATRSRKKAEAEAPADEAAAEAAAPAEAPEAAVDAEASAAPKKRATRSRKKADAEAPTDEAAPAEAAQGAAAVEQSADAPAAGGDQPAEAAQPKRGRGRRAQTAVSEGEQSADGSADADAAAAKPEGEQGAAEGDKPARNRRGRGRGQKAESGDAAESGEQGQANEDGKGRSQTQNGNGGNGNGGAKDSDGAARSSRTRQRDRKRRGQNDDLEPEITEDDVLLPIAGILDVLDNYAFVRTSGYLPGTSDVYVSLGQVKKYGMRRGDAVVGAIRQPREGDGGSRQKYNAIVKVDSLNGRPVEESEKRVDIAELTPVFPQEPLRLAGSGAAGIGSAIDAAAPMSLGQRALVTLPAGVPAVPVLAELAEAIAEAKPEAHLMLVLTNAHPEAATALQRTVRGEVVASTFDRSAEDQATIAELAIDRARRLVELGHDVVVLVDSLSDIAQAFAQAVPGSRGHQDPQAFAIAQVKQLLAAARNLENSGSLTIVATARHKSHAPLDKELRLELAPIANSFVRLTGSRLALEVDADESYTLGAF